MGVELLYVRQAKNVCDLQQIPPHNDVNGCYAKNAAALCFAGEVTEFTHGLAGNSQSYLVPAQARSATIRRMIDNGLLVELT